MRPALDSRISNMIRNATLQRQTLYNLSDGKNGLSPQNFVELKPV